MLLTLQMKQFGKILTQFTHWHFILAPITITHTLHLRGDAYGLPVIVVFLLTWALNLVLCIRNFHI